MSHDHPVKAMFQQPARTAGAVRCTLCAHRCVVKPGKRGICKVRENRGGALVTLSHGMLTSLVPDPIEKKPLFHYLPTTQCMSVATAGCNLRCPWCQNHSLSRMEGRAPSIPGRWVEPSEIVARATRSGCRSMSFTYSEPTIFYEYAREIGILAREKGLGNNFVTNGHMTSEVLRDASQHFLDAANIDLKASRPEIYKRLCKGRLEPVKDSIVLMRELGIWVEVTTLVIPSVNDGDEDLNDIATFLASVDRSIPWHLSRFHPELEFRHVGPTPLDTLQRGREIGRAAGLDHVYMGNVRGAGGESTECPDCGNVVMQRIGFSTTLSGLDGSRCSRCGREIAGVFA